MISRDSTLALDGLRGILCYLDDRNSTISSIFHS